MPLDLKDISSIKDRKEMIKAIKAIAQAVMVSAVDYIHPIRLVHIESITAGDYCSFAME